MSCLCLERPTMEQHVKDRRERLSSYSEVVTVNVRHKTAPTTTNMNRWPSIRRRAFSVRSLHAFLISRMTVTMCPPPDGKES